MDPMNRGHRQGSDSGISTDVDCHSPRPRQNDENEAAPPTPSDRAAPLESHRYYRDMLATRATSRSTDTLDVYTSYVSWIFRTDGHISGRPYLVQILKDAVDRFDGIDRFKNDPRYVRLYLSYGNYYGGSYHEILKTMESSGVGTEIAFFYEAFARCQVLSAEFDNARETLLRGLKRKAKPIKQMERFYEEFEVTMKEYLHTRARKNEATVETGRHNEASTGVRHPKQHSQGLLQSRTNRNVAHPTGAGGSRLGSLASLSSRDQNQARTQQPNKENGSGKAPRTEPESCKSIPPTLSEQLQAVADWESRFPVKQEGDKWTRSLFDFNEIYQGGQEFQIEEIRARLPKYSVPPPKSAQRKGRPPEQEQPLGDIEGVAAQGNGHANRDKGKGKAVMSSTWGKEAWGSPPSSDLPADAAERMQSYLKEDKYNDFGSDEEDMGTSSSPTMHTAFAADRMNKLFSHDTNLSAEQIFGTPWGEDETEDLGRDELDNFTMAYSIPTEALANTAEFSIPSLGFSNAAELDGPPVQVGSDDEVDLTSITLAIQAMKRKNIDRGSQDYQDRSGKMRSRLERELERQRFEAEAGPSDITLDLRHQRQLLQEQRQEHPDVYPGNQESESLSTFSSTPLQIFHDDAGTPAMDLNVSMLEDEAPPPALHSHDDTL